MRLLVARCEVRYSGRLHALLPEAVRLLMFKGDGSVLVHSDSGGYKPQNWMTPPTVIEEADDGASIVVRKRGGEDRLDIRIAEVLSDVEHDFGPPEAAAPLEKDGVEAHLQELLADAPQWCGEGFRLVRREWPTDIGPVDLIREDPELGGCRGVLVAQVLKPQARALAASRGIDCVEVDLGVLRGEREPDLQLFAA